jgi:hypothetical protein
VGNGVGDKGGEKNSLQNADCLETVAKTPTDFMNKRGDVSGFSPQKDILSGLSVGSQGGEVVSRF